MYLPVATACHVKACISMLREIMATEESLFEIDLRLPGWHDWSSSVRYYSHERDLSWIASVWQISSTPQIHALSLQLIVCAEIKVSVCVSERYRMSPNWNATNYLLIDSSRWKLKHFGATSRCGRKSIRWHAAGSSANLLLLLRGRWFLMPIKNK